MRVDVPTTPTKVYGDVPLVDVAATWDEAEGAAAVFLVNRSLDSATEVTIELPASLAGAELEAVSLHDEDVYAKNTKENPDRVAPKANESARIEGSSLTITLPAVSWTAVRLAGR